MNVPPIIASLTVAELKDLTYAKALLETPGFMIRMANFLGSPIEKGFALLPKDWSEMVHKASHAALLKALELAVVTMDKRGPSRSSEFFHKLLAGASGGIGGVFGLLALPVELPISTSIMLRSIADIARSEGHNLAMMDTKLACLEVFALGGKRTSDDAVESAYWIVRASLSRAISEAGTYLTQKGIAEQGAPAVLRLITAIASRFGIIVSEQAAAKAVPVVGAASGSIINVLFIDHFQDMARGHFIVKRLETKYGSELLQRVYAEIAV